MLLIDAANVVGSRPDGWWHDRAGATRTLTEQVRQAVADGALDTPVVLVIEGKARGGVEECTVDGVEVIHAPGQGDDTLAAVAADADDAVIVVSADRGLGERVRCTGAEVVGPSWLRARLEA